MNLSDFGNHNPFKWTNRLMVKNFTNLKRPLLTDPHVINAFLTVDRADFLPEEFRELAYIDRLLRIGQGQVTTNPILIARKLQILQPVYGGKYLHLGTGTGYLATLLAFIAGNTGSVFSLERIQLLWDQARQNSASYIATHNLNLSILYRDGAEGLEAESPFDGIIFSYVPKEYPSDLLNQLNIGGRMIFPNDSHQMHLIEKIGRDEFIDEQFSDFNAYAFGNYKPGLR